MTFLKAPGFTSRQSALLLALAIGGILLRLVALDRSYWFDELATVTNVDAPDLTTVLHITARDNQPPLYNGSIFFWSQLFGFSEVAVRALSLLFGLLALATPWLARRSLDRTEKLLLFTILCLMPLPIRYSQEARNYSVLFLLSCTSLFLYYEMLVAGARRLQLPFYGCLLLLAFSHLFGLLLAVSFLAVIFWHETGIFRRLALAVYGAALTAAVIGPLLHGGSGELAGGNFWITFSAASLGRQLLMVLTPVGLVLLAYALYGWRRDPQHAPLPAPLLQAITPFALMLLGAVLISLNTPILTDRNLIGLIAAFALLSVWFLRRIPTPWPSALLLSCLLLAQAAALTFSPYLFIQQEFRGIAQRSVAANQRICYVVPLPDIEKHLPQRLYSFYTVRLLGRPDLAPILMRPTDVPQDLHSVGCTLWADANLSRRGVSLLRTMPQFSRCTDVALGKPGVRLASELLDCGS